MFPHGSSDAPGYQCGPYNLDDDEQGPWRAFRGQTSQTSHLRLGKPLTDEEDEDDDQDDDDDDDFGVTSEQNLESQARHWLSRAIPEVYHKLRGFLWHYGIIIYYYLDFVDFLDSCSLWILLVHFFAKIHPLGGAGKSCTTWCQHFYMSRKVASATWVLRASAQA